MFRGASNITLDSKNRITIPTRYRESLFADFEGKMVCTLHTESRCLLLYPLSEWEELELKLSRLSDMNPSERTIKRILLGNATECEIDKSGRLLLSSVLRQHANLEKNVILVGLFNKFEIWNEDDWQTQMHQGIEDNQQGKLELTERLSDLSL
ncbi:MULTISPECIES: division/cell wall cluster transcriptional repressor MraZ [unclassified Thalassotalea]|uniref:division/cell wall cluster transcriptional repressor MraZ n=1 Tax=unclassified Thalassotalea TaxID=2614972 RepID=UPI001080ED61|nr:MULTISPECIES: division/cell wall cluster transcriptional repressor MraZ [unclassified Thalassotalea]NMP15767.1 division/cell wall cluster transcriptional repressor MraZ [Thalassotalea sp. Y01]QBY04818.1 division/cell wall cluster transcriptional repressor MraZ [Thalassotalea sp. HSM 43]